MASTMDITKAVSSDMTNVVQDFSVDARETDGASEQGETTWDNVNWAKYWGYFNSVPDLKSALLMKGIWDVGKGWTADTRTETILDNITGWGKDTFDDILFNMDVISSAGGDGFAEIMRNQETGDLLNLKPLDPGTIRTVVDDGGILLRYEQTAKRGLIRRTLGIKAKTLHKFEPNEIFHLANNRLADQIHGISDIEGLEETIKADMESFEDMKKLMHHQVRPFIIWKLQVDEPGKVADLVAKIDKARNLGEDMYLPDDDDAIKWEIVQLNPSQLVLSWRDDIRNRFFRAIMLPQVVPGAGGQGTESESKVIIFAFEQIVEKRQRFIEKQVWNQLGLKIDLIHPASIKPEMQEDEAKDAGRGTEVAQPSDITAGEGL